DAAALLRELAYPVDERLGLGELEPIDVALRELRRDLELLVLSFGRPGRLERKLRPALERVAVAEPRGHRGCGAEGLEANLGLLVCEHLHGPLGELARRRGIGALVHDRLGERPERPPLHLPLPRLPPTRP